MFVSEEMDVLAFFLSMDNSLAMSEIVIPFLYEIFWRINVLNENIPIICVDS